MKHFNGLTPAEAERLAFFAEEMGEAIQIIGKILRHGYESYHPDSPDISNRQLLEKETGHVMAGFFMLTDDKNKDINHVKCHEHAFIKSQKVKKYMHHQ
jgi:hypothetical protein